MAHHMTPRRIQLSRARGWRMPANTVKVDRTTKFGNPFRVGPECTAIRAVYEYVLMFCGFLCLSVPNGCVERQQTALKVLKAAKRSGYAELRGKNLACWCRPSAPCHADVLLEVVNRPLSKRTIDLDAILARYGWRQENGRLLRLPETVGDKL